MDHVAIDVGGRESQICVRTADGKIVEEQRCLTKQLGRYLELRGPSVVILETCAEAFGIADEAREHGHDVRVVAATLVKALGVGERGVKTDRRDAQLLSKASCRMELPSVHIASRMSRERKSMCGMREALVASRTMLVNNVRGWLRGGALRLRTGGVESFAARVRKLDVELPSYVDRQLEAIIHLCEAIEDADKELAKAAKADETCVRLMSVPGVGPVTALRFVAAIDDQRRFDDAHKLESYLGITPGERSSSDRRERTGITHAGSPRTRWALVQAAWNARRTRPNDPMVVWATEVEKRRGKRVAIVALARKLAGILYAIWRDKTVYDPNHEAAPRAA